MTQRRFNEQDVEVILGRAAQFSLEHDSDAQGLTLKQIRNIACEASIPPECVDEAVAQLLAERASVSECPDAQETTESIVPSSGDDKYSYALERVFNCTIGEFSHQQIIHLIEEGMVVPGTVLKGHGVLSWKSMSHDTKWSILDVGRDKLMVRVIEQRSHMGVWATGVFVCCVLWAAGLIISKGEFVLSQLSGSVFWSALVWLLLVFGVGWLFCQVVARRIEHRQNQRLKSIMAHIERLLQA